MKVEAIQPAIQAFKIEATADEAKLLMDLLALCGGPPTSRRGLADSMQCALRNAGARPSPGAPDNRYRPADMASDASAYFR